MSLSFQDTLSDNLEWMAHQEGQGWRVQEWGVCQRGWGEGHANRGGGHVKRGAGAGSAPREVGAPTGAGAIKASLSSTRGGHSPVVLGMETRSPPLTRG